MKHKIISLLATCMSVTACMDTSQLESDLSGLEDRVAALEATVSQVNSNIIAIQAVLDDAISILGCTEREDGTGYDLELSDGTTASIYAGKDGKGITPVIGIDKDGNWTVQVGNGEPEIIEGSSNAFGEDAAVPQVRVSSDGIWQISTDEGSSWQDITDNEGNPVYASSSDLTDSFFTDVEYDEASGTLKITLADGRDVELQVLDILTMEISGFNEGGETILLNESLHFQVKFSDDVAEAFCKCPDGWRVQITETDEGHEIIVTGPSSGTAGEYEVKVYLQSENMFLRVYALTFVLNPVSLDEAACTEWNEFISEDEDNVLLDFSYAGYMHGETAPPEVTIMESGGRYIASNGYTVYNITDYGAVADDDVSDREAFISLLSDVFGKPELNPAGTQLTFPHNNAPRNAVIYFPEGEFILHTADDDVNGISQSLVIRGSNYILKGAGRDKTNLVMAAPNQQVTPGVLYSSLDMIQLKHNTGVQTGNVLATVTGDSRKGDFSVTVDGAGSLNAGDWVCLYMAPNPDPSIVAEELAPFSATASWEIATSGVTVEDLHQVKSASGNTVTFCEPLMHEIKADWGWTIVRYQHYENVGVEDLTFTGYAKENFDHHASWEDDGAYKPISMTRLVNSWMRRVGFHSVSEACSIISSANVSAYDIVIDGNRGHSAIRSERSSRVFIGKVDDHASGNMMDDLGHNVTGTWSDRAGQYHATGVSKQSMGTVLWRNVWGEDGCFEAHATQPRATLIDCCSGAMMRWRQGGDAAQMPNHLDDLTIWNFNATNARYSEASFIWWDNSSQWWKFLPPVIVGFHGAAVTFDESQTKRLSSNGTPVTPESLYEAQLSKRLGYVPAWLNALK